MLSILSCGATLRVLELNNNPLGAEGIVALLDALRVGRGSEVGRCKTNPGSERDASACMTRHQAFALAPVFNRCSTCCVSALESMTFYGITRLCEREIETCQLVLGGTRHPPWAPYPLVNVRYSLHFAPVHVGGDGGGGHVTTQPEGVRVREGGGGGG